MKFRDVSSSDEACPDWMLSEFWQVFGLSLLTCVLRDLLQELSGYSRCLTKLFSAIRDGDVLGMTWFPKELYQLRN